jgi:hypothetical protein
VQDGALTVDRYRDFHPDIFVHPNGHAVVGNNVAASVIAAIPLLVFNPVLNQLERTNRRGFGATDRRRRSIAPPITPTAGSSTPSRRMRG